MTSVYTGIGSFHRNNLVHEQMRQCVNKSNSSKFSPTIYGQGLMQSDQEKENMV